MRPPFVEPCATAASLKRKPRLLQHAPRPLVAITNRGRDLPAVELRIASCDGAPHRSARESTPPVRRRFTPVTHLGPVAAKDIEQPALSMASPGRQPDRPVRLLASGVRAGRDLRIRSSASADRCRKRSRSRANSESSGLTFKDVSDAPRPILRRRAGVRGELVIDRNRRHRVVRQLDRSTSFPASSDDAHRPPRDAQDRAALRPRRGFAEERCRS